MPPIPNLDYYHAGSEEKELGDGLPSNAPSARRPRSRVRRALRWAVVLAVAAQGLLIMYPDALSAASETVSHGCAAAADAFTRTKADRVCPQEDALVPQRDANAKLWDSLGKDIGSDEFKERAIKWHSGAVQIPTESYDKMAPVGEDPRWEAFAPFHEYLLKSFPNVHATLQLTKINTYGLVYIWKGSDPSLKPLLLMAHQDVVPVDPKTAGQWAHPPYSGHYDGTRIWGRGSMDDKSGLMGILIAIETLIEKGFAPTREVVLSFGFDEEASGVYGAQENAKALTTIYGKNSFALIVDEGAGFNEAYGGVIAIPGIAEKGYLDVRVKINTPGGHSSIPPAHTGIGMLAHLLVKYEHNPMPAVLQRDTPVYGMIQCMAHAPGLSHKIKRAITHSLKSDRALRHVQDEFFNANPMWQALAGTTQAIDIIAGGVKSNALPEEAFAVVNHRIDTASSVGAVMKHDARLLMPLAKEFNLSLVAFGKHLTKEDATTEAWGSLELSDAWGTALEPAPVTPSDAKPYQLLAKTIKAVYAAHRSDHLAGEEKDKKKKERADEIIIAPGIMSGNTDTRYYWDLSEHIFRYNHMNGKGGRSNGLGKVHTVNESIVVDAFLEQIRFFNTLILNVDEADL